MKIEKLISYQLNHDTLKIMATIKDNYPEAKTIIMNLKTISKELNNIVIGEITGNDEK